MAVLKFSSGSTYSLHFRAERAGQSRPGWTGGWQLWGLRLPTPCIRMFGVLPSPLSPGTTLSTACDNADHTPPCPAHTGAPGSLASHLAGLSSNYHSSERLPGPPHAHFLWQLPLQSSSEHTDRNCWYNSAFYIFLTTHIIAHLNVTCKKAKNKFRSMLASKRR